MILFRMTTAFVDFNGVVPEKVSLTIRIYAYLPNRQTSSMQSSYRTWLTPSTEIRVSTSRWSPVKVSVG